jgi:ubiquitin carboxyl-terminal hydrolase 9/24
LDPTTGEPYFPVSELARLEEMISRTRWVVPVLPKCELEILLDASINLCRRELDTRSEACQRFFQDGLTKSFTKILTDDAVSSWKFEIHRCILRKCEKLIDLCVSKLRQDWFSLLELLAEDLNPQCKFHTFNRPKNSSLLNLFFDFTNFYFLFSRMAGWLKENRVLQIVLFVASASIR